MEESKEEPSLRREEELAWARGPRESVPKMEKKAEEYQERGLTQKPVFMLGFALETITGDDVNIFSPFSFDPSLSTPEARERAGLKLSERLSWEEGYEYLPVEIRERIREVREEIGKLNWAKQEDFDKGQQIWYEKVRDWVEAKLSEDPKLYDARISFKELEVWRMKIK